MSQLADELGVCWHTVMDAVRAHGEPLVDDPDHVGMVAQLGVDETSWLRATKDHATIYATGLVNLTRRIVIDVISGKQRQGSGFLARSSARCVA